MDTLSVITNHPLFMAAGIAGFVAALGMYIDHRNHRRTNLDKVSLVSWGLISTLAIIIGVVCLAVGIRTEL